MQKKGYFVTSSIAKGILVLVILGLTFKIVIDLTGNPVKYLLGYGNISKLDEDIVERYEMTKGLNQDAITSTNGLLYAVNSLAVFDTERQEEKNVLTAKVKEGLTKKEDLGAYKKDFDDVKVEPAYFDRRTIYLKGDKENVMDTLIKATFDCWGIFGDKANENTRCFLVKVDKDVKLDWFNDFDDYFKNFDCSKLCKDAKKIDECKDKCGYLKYDLSGSRSWNPLSSFFGLFNAKNYEYGITPKLIVENNYEFRICSNNDLVNEIHFSVKEDYCETPKEDLAFGYFVENFALPQTIEKSTMPVVGKLNPIYTVEEWLNAYGDPEYILFYEKFPKEEAEYWSEGSYNIAFLTILGTEAVFLGIDVITLGLGPLLKPIVTPLGKVISKGTTPIKNAIKGFVKRAGSAFGRALRLVWSKTGGRAVNAILRRQLTKETLEESAENIVKRTLKRILKKATYNQLDDDTFKLLRKKYLEAFESLADDAFDQSGRLTKNGINQLQDNFGRVMKGTFKDSAEDRVIMSGLKSTLGNQYDDILLNLGEELSQEVSQAGLRMVPRNLIKSYRAAGRGMNVLKETFYTGITGDMTDARKIEVLMTAMDDWEKPFRAMRPYELRTFVANQKSATEMLDRMIAGEIGDAADKAAAQALRENMDEVLEKVVKTRGDLGKLFPVGANMQGYTVAALEAEGKVAKEVITKPRHLAALMAGYYATRIESMQAKFYSVGTNAIGLKIPYAASVPYDDTYTKDVTSTNDAKKWLEEYGSDPKHTGLLPVVNEYFLSLTKDQSSWWFDQDPQRFHLVSPCYADIILTVSNCNCKGTEDEEAGLYETGKLHEIYGEDENGNKIFTGETTNVPNFDGERPMLYRLDENGEPIKECYAGKWYRWDDPYPTKCIKINPILNTYKDFEYNYCYHGKDPSFEIVKGTITSLEIGLPLLCITSTLGAGTIPCLAGLGFVGGFTGESIKAIMETQHKWPNHS